MMCTCWNEEADKRPSFKELESSLNLLLEDVAGYLDFSTFAVETYSGNNYDHLNAYNRLEVYNCLEAYYHLDSIPS